MNTISISVPDNNFGMQCLAAIGALAQKQIGQTVTDEPRIITPHADDVFKVMGDKGAVIDKTAEEIVADLERPIVAPPPPSPAQTTDDVKVALAQPVELDSRGYPWDARIHSANKTRIKSDDSWKYMRGVDKAVIQQVEAEYQAKGYGTQTVAPVPPISQQAPVPPISQQAPVPPISQQAPVPPISQQAPVPPISQQAPAAPVPPVTTQQASGGPIVAMSQLIPALTRAGLKPQDPTVLECCKKHGIINIGLCATSTNQHLIPIIAEELGLNNA